MSQQLNRKNFNKAKPVDKLVCVTEFADFIQEKIPKKGTPGYVRSQQGDFCKATGLSEGTVSRWREGSPPNFYSCLVVAKYYKLNPIKIFEMSEQPHYTEIYKWFFPEYKRMEVSLSDIYESKEEQEAHEQLQGFLERDAEATKIILDYGVSIFRHIDDVRGR